MERNIAYIGPDRRYFEALQEEFKSLYGQADTFVFSTFWEDGEGILKKLILKVIEHKPEILYIDYTVNAEAMTQLGWLIKNLNISQDIFIVGLLNPQEKENIRKNIVVKVIESGVRLTQVKDGGNLHDPVYCAYHSKWPKSVKEPEFVKVKSKEGIDTKIGEVMRISMISMDEFLVESNLSFEVGDLLELETFIPEDVLPSKFFKVKSIKEGGTFYRMLNSVVLTPLYADEVDQEKYKDEPSEYEAEQKRRFDSIHGSIKPQFESWLFQQMVNSNRKVVKALVIDRNLDILDQCEGWIGDLPYSIRLQTDYNKEDKLVTLYHPHLVIWVMEDVPEPPEIPEVDPESTELVPEPTEEPIVIDPNDYNGFDSLKRLTANLNPEDKTTLIVFGAKEFTSDELKTKLNYPLALASKESFSFEAVNNMLMAIKSSADAENAAKDLERIKGEAAIAEAKAQTELKQLAAIKKEMAKKGKVPPKKKTTAIVEYKNPESPRYYVDKMSEYSSAILWEPIKIFVINEVQMDFEFKREIPIWSAFILRDPIEVNLLILEQKDSNRFKGQSGMHFALNHSMEIDARNKLRAFLIRNKD